MTCEVMDAAIKDDKDQGMSHHLFHRKSPAPDTSAGQHLRHLRQQAGLSQLALSLLAGVSQRHLSCLETGRAKASPGTLHALLSALGAPLEHCNEVFIAAGYAPRYAASPLDAPELALVHAAIEHILQANNPAPAIVIDSNWQVIAANASTGLLLAMVGVAAQAAPGLNLLDTLLRLAAWAIIWPMRSKFVPLPGNVHPGRQWVTRRWQRICAIFQPRPTQSRRQVSRPCC